MIQICCQETHLLIQDFAPHFLKLEFGLERKFDYK